MNSMLSSAGRGSLRHLFGIVGLLLVGALVGYAVRPGSREGQTPKAAVPDDLGFGSAALSRAPLIPETLRAPVDSGAADGENGQSEPPRAEPVVGAWFPTPPDRDLGGMMTSEVLASFYGSEFPKALEDMGGLANKLYQFDNWMREPGHRLGEAGPSLEAIKRMMIERCNKRDLLFGTVFEDGWVPQAIYSATDFTGSLNRVLADHAVAHGKPKAHLPFKKQEESRARIEELCRPRALLIDELVAKVRECVTRDLEPVSLTQQPAVGSMHVGVMNWVPKAVRERRDLQPSRWWFSTLGQGGPRSHYVGYYIALATDFPECNAVIQQILAAESSLEAALAAEKQWWLDNCEWKDA
jgi:hypothetical protein